MSACESTIYHGYLAMQSVSIGFKHLTESFLSGLLASLVHFLKIDPVQIIGMCVCLCVCVCVCVCVAPYLITSGMMWRDMDLIQLVKQSLQLLYIWQL